MNRKKILYDEELSLQQKREHDMGFVISQKKNQFDYSVFGNAKVDYTNERKAFHC